MENFLTVMEPIIKVLLALMLLSVTLVFFHLYKVIRLFSRIADRIETLTDIKGWFDMFKGFGRKRRKKKRRVIYEDE